jgi:hypothetical protein
VKAISGAFLAAVLLALGSMPAFADIALRAQPVTSHVQVIPWRAAATERAHNTTVIEQSDGLAVIDPAPTEPSDRRLVDAIRKSSRKPVKYLIYTHDRGHDPATRLFLRTWPHLTVLATDVTRDCPSGGAMAYIQAYAHDYAGEIALAREQLKRADLLPEMRSGWQRLVDAGKTVTNDYSDLKAYLATLVFSDRLDLPDRETPVEVLYLERVDGNGGAIVWAPTERVLYAGSLAEPLPHTLSDPLARLRLVDRIAAYDFAYLIPDTGEVRTDRAYFGTAKASMARVRDEMTPVAKAGAAFADAYRQGDIKSLMTAFTGDAARGTRG